MLPITPQALFNHRQCEHRLTLDSFGNPDERDEESPFIELLWRQASEQYETVFGNNPNSLSKLKDEKRIAETLHLMQQKAPLIYGGKLRYQDMEASIDLMRMETNPDGTSGYVPVYLKTAFGTPEEDSASETPDIDTDTANKICLAVNILDGLQQSAGRVGYSQNQHGMTVEYDLQVLRGKRNPTSLWDDYLSELGATDAVIKQTHTTRPAYAAACKLCHWQTKCMKQLQVENDLTLIPELGRGKRDAMAPFINTIEELATKDMSAFIVGKKTQFKGIGVDTLLKFQKRAQLLHVKGSKPYLKETLSLPESLDEIHFDIEVDPMHDFCYLHGFVERTRNSENHKYIPFLAEQIGAAEEEIAFAGAWKYLQANQDVPVYYYSSYERTIWKKLARKYPTVCSEDEVIALFELPHWVDLYTHVVRGKTEWPINDYSVKTIAKWLGFNWRDPHPSGAASIEWFARWIETGDNTIKDRILEYNEDDCVATGVVLDAIRVLPVI